MGSINSRNGKLYIDFRYHGVRCREQSSLSDTKRNRKQLEVLLNKIESEIALGMFDYATYFPNSSRAKSINRQIARVTIENVEEQTSPTFSIFAEIWFAEKLIEWRTSQSQTVRGVLDKHLIPKFGNYYLHAINKAEILAFRAGLAKEAGRSGKKLSASRINHIMSPLRVILNEAADRYQFVSPWINIKALKVPRTDIQPFSLPEVKRILETVRADFKPYFTVRFFTGLRSGEIDGLMWKHVKLDEGLILVHQSLVRGELVSTKTDGSFRNVQISEPVRQALLAQEKLTKGKTEYVFANRKGNPLDNRNVTQKIWYPLLRFLGLEKRTPYQTRHTAATLWLAAGESPEWIAKQLGHSTTTMLFRVYSRYVPNLTRQDGSAFEKLLQESED